LPCADHDGDPFVDADPRDRSAYDDALRALYHPHYHDDKGAPGYRAAARVLPIVFTVVDVASIVDVGCGSGSWLAAARDLGISDLTGIEGDWAIHWFGNGQADRDSSRIARDQFELVMANLEDELVLSRTYDLAICAEVIEHLTPQRGPSFVSDVCRLSRRVLLGAAIPGQRGPNHRNTRWPSYWTGLLADHHYRVLDVVRPRIWADDDLRMPYRQNLLLFVHEDEYGAASARAAGLPVTPAGALDLVHPALLRRYQSELRSASEPGLRGRIRLAAGIPRAAWRRFRR
jgi:SAM-dependent methyltransferase